MAQRDIALEIKTTVDAADSAKTLGQLRRTLLDIQNLQAEIGDESSADFAKLQSAAAATQARMASVRDSVGDIGDKIRTLEGTPVERLKGSFGLLQEAIVNLDFDKLMIGLEGVDNSLKNITKRKVAENLEQVASVGEVAADSVEDLADGLGDLADASGESNKGIGGLAGGVTNLGNAGDKTSKSTGGMGNAFKLLGSIMNTIGKSLLTNPIFLIAAAIAAFVAVLAIVLNRLGLLKPLLEAVGKYFEFLMSMVDMAVEAFKNLMYWAFGAGFAAAKEAERVAAAEKRKRDAYELTLESSNKLRDITISNMEEGEAKRKAIFKAEMEDAKIKLKADEEAAISETIKRIGWNVESLKTIQKIREDYANIRKQMKIQEENGITKIEEDSEKERADNRKDNADKAAAKTKQEQADKLSAAEKGLDDIRIAQDKLIARTTEGSQERVDAVKASLKAQYDYIVINNEILGKDLAALKVEQDQIIADEVAKFQKAEAERINLKENTLAEIKILEATNNEERIAAEIDAIRVKSQNEIENTELTEEQKKLIALKAAKDIKDIEDQAAKEAKERQQELLDLKSETAIIEAENKVAQIELELEQENLRTDERIALIEKLKEAELQALEEKKTKELQDIEATRQAKILAAEGDAAAIGVINENAKVQQDSVNQRFAESERQISIETTDKINAEQERRLKKSMDIGQQMFKSISSLAESIFAMQNTFGKKGTEAEERRARQQFEIRKKLQIAEAVIQTISGVINALTAPSVIPEPFASIQKGINAVSVAAAGIANIAKIQRSKYESPGDAGGAAGGGGGGAAPNMATPNMAAPTAAPQATFTPAQFFQLGQAQPGAGAQQQPIQVVVTETDITSTQTKVKVIEDRATID